MTDKNKLKSKIAGKGFTIKFLAQMLDASEATLSQKINNKVKFSTEDIKDISKILELTADEIRDIFLN